MTIIVCADRNWAIGRDNQLLFRISADLKRFKAITMGHSLLMGRRTFESLPGPLPGRAHTVLSRNPDFAPTGVTACRSLEEGITAAASHGKVFVIGGAEIYAALLPYCDVALVTRVDEAVADADARFPNLDEHPHWRLAEAGEWREERGIWFRFCAYNRDGGA